MPTLKPVSRNLLFTKNDSEDPRLGECVQIDSDSFQNDFDFVVVGYPDDEGVAANGGRVGAAAGPDSIRQALYKMTPHLNSHLLPRIKDVGNLSLEQPLAERHEQGREIIKSALSQKQATLSFGGGHDYGYADTAGFLDLFPDGIVLNFDAHLDVRPTHKGLNSGTAFYRMLSQYPQVHFFEIGIQNQCNSRAHYNWVLKQGGSVISLDEIRSSSLLATLTSHLGKAQGAKVFISFDIDAFTSSEAPGCSQSWASGLHYAEVAESLSWLYKNFEVKGLGIYEVSPPLDHDNRTSKLAALLAHQFIFSRNGL